MKRYIILELFYGIEVMLVNIFRLVYCHLSVNCQMSTERQSDV